MYTLGDEIGFGALGRVVKVHGPNGEVWAGKILHASRQTDERGLARFLDEGKMLVGLAHPNLVEVMGVHTIDGQSVLVMEYVPGPSLADVLTQEGRFAEPRAAALALGIARGLAAAHQVGLVHRDLKPSNILIGAGGTAKITDFGLARASSFEGVARESLAIVGSPEYLAPESIDPLAVDARSDLYSLGCVLYELLCGHPPYRGPTAFALIEAHREAPIPAVSGANPWLAELATQLLAKSPADRPQSARVVEEALSQGTFALARTNNAPLTNRTRCTRCGEPILVEVGACFRCGVVLPSIGKGNMCVLIVGPGETTHKLDARLRERLLAWLKANPWLGLDTSQLEKAVPRLPFVLIRGVAPDLAEFLREAVAALGLECEIRAGGRFGNKEMVKKAWALSGRSFLVAGITSLYIARAALAVLLPVLAVASTAAGWVMAGRAVTKGTTKRFGRTFSSPLTESLASARTCLPAIDGQRNRDAARAVIDRALLLRKAVPKAARDEVERDLATLIAAASVAAANVDQAERELKGHDVREPSPLCREIIRQRDRDAAWLLDAAGFLDSLRLRYLALATEERGQAEKLRELKEYALALQEASHHA